MERIVYRKTLDVHKSGVQFTLQGFETADKMSRRIEISLMASGDTIDFPLEQITALMYVTTPNATAPSINKCIIKDNKIIYDVLPIGEEGITEMQLKLIKTSADGAKSVLATPKFAVEVCESNVNDESAEQTTTFTALEDAVAQAKGVYDSRLLRIELDYDCMFRAYYADGNVYETDVLKELFLKGDALLSQSYARGGTGVRAGEDTDNSMYYSNVSRSASEETKSAVAESEEILTEVRQHGVYTAFSVDFETGEVKYISPKYTFNVNESTGHLDAYGDEYDADAVINKMVTEWLEEKTKVADEALAIAKGKNQARVFDTTNDMQEWLSNPDNAGVCQVGDNLYIVDVGVPDWWISAVLTEVDSKTGFWYEVALLETQKVNLSDIENDISNIENNIGDIENDITDIENDVDGLYTEVADVKTDLDELQTGVSDLESASNNLRTDVEKLKYDDSGTPTVVGTTTDGKEICRVRKEFDLGPAGNASETFVDATFNLDLGNVFILSINAFICSANRENAYPLPYFYDGELHTLVSRVGNLKDGDTTKVFFSNKANWNGHNLVVEIVYVPNSAPASPGSGEKPEEYNSAN